MKRIYFFILTVITVVCMMACSSSPAEVEQIPEIKTYTLFFTSSNTDVVIETEQMTVETGETFILHSSSDETIMYYEAVDTYYPVAYTCGESVFPVNTPIVVDEYLTKNANENNEITLTAAWPNPCLTGDTLITMADGSKKQIKDISVGESVLTYDFYTGMFETKNVILVEHQENILSPVMTITTDSGSKIEIVGYHSFFDAENLKYVDIGYYNYDQMNGRKILVVQEGSFVTQTITDISFELKNTSAYGILTDENVNCIANDMITVEPMVSVIIPFEINSNYVVDAEKMEQDIETYGVYTYEDFPFEVKEQWFDKLNLQYIKIMIAKGITTYEYMEDEMNYLPGIFENWK